MKILNEIEQYLKDEEIARKKVKESHYPSEATKCVRSLWYKWNNVDETDSPEIAAKLRMEFGNAIHDWVAATLTKRGLNVLTEIPFKLSVSGLKHQISGRCDNMILYEEDGKIHGLEVKTSYGRGIRELKKADKPKEDALNQVLIYFEGLSKFFNVTYFHIVYLGRDDGYRTEFVFEKKDDGIYFKGKKIDLTIDNIYDKLKEVEQCIEKKSPPERPYNAAFREGEMKDKFTFQKVDYKTAWQCSYCSYKTLCWKEIADKSKDTRYYGSEEIK